MWQIEQVNKIINDLTKKYPHDQLPIESDQIGEIDLDITLLYLERGGKIKIKELLLFGYMGNSKSDKLVFIVENLNHKERFIKYFDLVFDFENNEFWRDKTSKKIPFQITDSEKNKTLFHFFPILLKHKGEFLSKEDIENSGGVFPERGSAINCKTLDNYFRKTFKDKFSISENDIFSKPRMWLKYDKKEDKVKLVSD